MIRPRTRRRVVFAALTLAGLLLMAEAAVSVFGRATLVQWAAPVPVTHTGAPYLPGNPYLLWEMVAGERREMDVDVRVNAMGFRGPAITVEKPPNTKRILVVGDSTVYGHGVAEAETFVARIGEHLGTDFQVINLGVPGYSSAQALNLLALRGWELQPDLLIVATLWSDNNFDSFIDKELLSEQAAFQDGWLGRGSAALQNLALYRWLDWHLRLGPKAEAVNTVGWILGQQPSGGQRRVEVNDYATNLQRFVDGARRENADVMFLAFANSVDIGAETDGAIAWPLYREVMASVALHNGAPLVQVVPHFQSSGLSWEDLFLDELHPTPQGHEIIASAVHTRLAGWAESGQFSESSESPAVKIWDDPFARGEGPPPEKPGVARVTLSGSVLGAPEGTPIQIDLIDLNPDRSQSDNPMLGSARFDHVDPFEMPAPRSGQFGVRIYLDREADGPSKGDPVHEFLDPPIQATGDSLEGIVIDLSADTVRWVNKPPTSRGLPANSGASD